MTELTAGRHVLPKTLVNVPMAMATPRSVKSGSVRKRANTLGATRHLAGDLISSGSQKTVHHTSNFSIVRQHFKRKGNVL